MIIGVVLLFTFGFVIFTNWSWQLSAINSSYTLHYLICLHKKKMYFLIMSQIPSFIVLVLLNWWLMCTYLRIVLNVHVHNSEINSSHSSFLFLHFCYQNYWGSIHEGWREEVVFICFNVLFRFCLDSENGEENTQRNSVMIYGPGTLTVSIPVHVTMPSQTLLILVTLLILLTKQTLIINQFMIYIVFGVSIWTNHLLPFCCVVFNMMVYNTDLHCMNKLLYF